MSNQGVGKVNSMEALDQEVSDAIADQKEPVGPASILIACADSHCRAILKRLLNADRYRCVDATSCAECNEALLRGRFDLVLLDPRFADGDGLAIAQTISAKAPGTKLIVLTEGQSYDVVLRAMRNGAVDIVSLPINPSTLNENVDRAVDLARHEQARERRIERLKKVCRKLNTARREVSKKVDVLCQDLVSAYQEVAEQVSEVAMATEFATLLRQELDVEDLLRTTLEYLLTKTGPTNAAVFLPNSEQEYALGAYVNYDCPRESVSMLLDHLCMAICPQIADEHEIMSYTDTEEFAEWIGFDASLLADSQVVAFSCKHQDECLAVVVLFRNRQDPFEEELAGVIDTLRPIFAEQIAQVIKVHHRASPSWPDDTCAEDDEYDFNDDFDYGCGDLAA